MANATPAIKTRPDKLPRDSIICRHPSGQAEVRGQIVKASRTMVKTMGSHWGKGGSGSAKPSDERLSEHRFPEMPSDHDATYQCLVAWKLVEPHFAARKSPRGLPRKEARR